MMTTQNIEIENAMVDQYLYSLVNRFYKILPIKESGEPTLTKYIISLQREMLGCRDLICALKNDGQYLTLLAVLQYLMDHNDEIDAKVVKTEVFRAIGIIKRLRKQYAAGA